jgi:hypothetical protein
MPHALRQHLAFHRKLRLLAGIALPLAAAVLASSAAQAAPMDGSSGSSGGRPKTAVGPTMHPIAAARTPAPGEKTIVAPRATPFDASTGLFMEGGVSATWGSGHADLRVTDIANQRASGTSGDLTLHLIATAAVPAGSFTYFDLASVDLGTLDAGTDTGGVDTGEVAFAPPSPNGCYYISLLLLEDGNFADIRVFDSGGTPTNNAFALFAFGTTCPAATFCVRSANGACLDGGRFQVTATYNNDSTGSGAAQVLNFGSTRAESDESAFFYFTDPSNFELGVKVLDACAISPNFWVFIGGLTNQGWTVHVLDTQTGRKKAYGNAVNNTTVTVTDTSALPCP